MLPRRVKPWQIIAVSLALVAVPLFMLLDRDSAQPLMAAKAAALPYGGATVIGSSHAILQTRGSAVDAEIPLPPAGQAIELRVLPEFVPRPHYRIRLFRMTADDSLQTVAELGGLEPAADNFVTVYVDAARLRPGSYRLAIVGDNDTDAIDKESAFILRMRSRVNGPSATSR